MTEITPSETSFSEEIAPGWDAISAALDRLYPGQEPKHWGTLVPWKFSGPDPLDGISAWKRSLPAPHWHFVTYGLSELYEKESDNAEESGYGFELTFRLAADDGEVEPPNWVFSFFQNLARYVFQTGNVFEDGHWMNANGPIALETGTQLRSIAITADPELPPIETPNGRVAFLQLVGLTLDEEGVVKQWNTRKLLDTLVRHMPLWITDLSRTSLLGEPDVAAAVSEGVRRDGSSTGMLFISTLDWEVRKRFLKPAATTVVLGAGPVTDLVAMLPLRLPHGAEFHMMCQPSGKSLTFATAEADAVSGSGTELRIELTSATLDAMLQTLKPLVGNYVTPGFGALAWRIEQTLIRDAKGDVVKTIG